MVSGLIKKIDNQFVCKHNQNCEQVFKYHLDKTTLKKMFERIHGTSLQSYVWPLLHIPNTVTFNIILIYY